MPYGTIVVPLKQAGPLEEEMLASAAKLAAAEQGARVVGMLVFETPLEFELETVLEGQVEREGACRLLCEQFARDYKVPVELHVARGRAISRAIVNEARALDAGLILIGAVPRFGQRAGRDVVFSDTVENVLRRAHCRVIVTAFPPGTASIAEPEAPVGAGHPPR